jgi:hypothetical protein
VAAVAAGAVSALLVLLAVNGCAVGATFDLATVAAGFATVAATSASSADVDTFVAVVAAECVAFDLFLAGVDGSFDLGCVSTVLVSLGVSASLVPVWAPPLLLTVTPDPTSVLDDVVPDVFVVSVAVTPLSVDGDPPEVDSEPPPAVVAAVLLDVVLSELVDELVAGDSEDVPVEPVVSAAASP